MKEITRVSLPMDVYEQAEINFTVLEGNTECDKRYTQSQVEKS